jgi:cyanophycinase-like exopeptidase
VSDLPREPRLPRLLTIMGSGETAPTMAKVHRELLGRLGPPPVPAVVLDTPFGFQENADDIVARTRAYFAESVGADITVASLRSAAAADRLAEASFVAAVQQARYVFAGPGSPSYALRQWRGGPLPALLAEKLRTGGAVTFSSAAALTLGMTTVPVYEIYKAGEAPAWLEGLDILAESGLRAAVIPHYNNAEGGNHDTRYSYLGERRLAAMETELPQGAFVLGVDEHTGLILDLGAGSASVVGIGAATVRSHGRSRRLESGTTVPIAELVTIAGDLASRHRAAGVPVPEPAAPVVAPAGPAAPGADSESPLLAVTRRRQSAFAEALATGDIGDAVRSVFELDAELVAWSRDTLESEAGDRARDTLHAMVVSLGRLAEVGARDPAGLVGPFVEALLDQRARARSDRRFAEADAIRHHLTALGVEVRDTPTGTKWTFTPPDHPGVPPG